MFGMPTKWPVGFELLRANRLSLVIVANMFIPTIELQEPRTSE